MIFGEWNWDDALAVRYEEGVDTGIEKVFTLLRQGYSLEEAENMLGFNRSLLPNNLNQDKSKDNLILRILNFCKSKFR